MSSGSISGVWSADKENSPVKAPSVIVRFVDKPESLFYVKGIMFVVGDILVSDDIAGEAFSCHVGRCHGACCVHGDSGAPLEPDELPWLEAIVPRVTRYLGPNSRQILADEGPWETTSKGPYATRCVGGGECVFVTFEGPVARCAIHKAFLDGRTEFPKPISCHLYPVRAETYGNQQVLNYEHVSICDAGRENGLQANMPLARFLREPLVRKFGDDWYEKFVIACDDRRSVMAGTT